MWRKNKQMTNITTTNTTKNAVEIRTELGKNGTKIEYIVINGQKVGILGSANANDRAKAIKAIQTALDASNGNIYEMIQKLQTIATIEEHEIDADEMIEIDGADVIISYASKAAYLTNGEELANCAELPDMPKEAIKAVLEARAKIALAEMNEDEEW
jgi:hypothetical protein